MTSFVSKIPAAALAALLAVGPAAAQTSGHDMTPAMATGSAEAVELGDLSLTNAFAFATLPNQPVAGGFLTIANGGAVADRLVSVASPVAGRVEVHQMQMEGDVMQMREIASGLEIPAGETVTLQPGGLHIMFMDLGDRLDAGTTIPVTLSFERAGKVTLDVPVIARPPRGHADG